MAVIVALVVIVGFSYVGSVLIGRLMKRRQSKLGAMLFEHKEDL